MRARQRHLKPKSLSATAAWDSRYVSGLSDGNAVSTWSDLSGNGNDATQATGTRQPLYKTAIIGGAPSIRFDGTDDNLSHTADNNSSECSIIAVLSRITAQTSYRGIFAAGAWTSAGTMMLSRTGLTPWGTYTGTDARASSTIATGSPTILVMIDNAASGGSFYVQGVSDGTWTGNTEGQEFKHIGGVYSATAAANQVSNMDLGALYLLSSAASSALRRRLERGFGYSFKIACS